MQEIVDNSAISFVLQKNYNFWFSAYRIETMKDRYSRFTLTKKGAAEPLNFERRSQENNEGTLCYELTNISPGSF